MTSLDPNFANTEGFQRYLDDLAEYNSLKENAKITKLDVEGANFTVNKKTWWLPEYGNLEDKIRSINTTIQSKSYERDFLLHKVIFGRGSSDETKLNDVAKEVDELYVMREMFSDYRDYFNPLNNDSSKIMIEENDKLRKLRKELSASVSSGTEKYLKALQQIKKKQTTYVGERQRGYVNFYPISLPTIDPKTQQGGAIETTHSYFVQHYPLYRDYFCYLETGKKLNNNSSSRTANINNQPNTNS